jgi:chromosome segregation ATPase
MVHGGTPGSLNEENNMSAEFSNDEIKTTEERHSSHTGIFAILAIGLVVALAGDGFLLVRMNHLNDQMSLNGDATQAQISKLGDATTSLLEQRLASINDEISSEVKGVQSSAATALKQARAQAAKQQDELRGKLDEQQQQVTGQIAELKDATSNADNKIAAVSTDVDGVKTDVSGVKTDVASTKDNLEKTGADLKRAIGDMGVMSGLIATNSKDLQALRELGDRNYVEFDLSKGKMQQKIGDVVVTLRKSDPKHNRYTVDVLADDKTTEKKDKTINEPVQVYVHNSKQPYEIVVNQVKKDEIVGYLSTPKVTLARQ